MKPMLTHVAGVDVHKEMLVITTLVGVLDQEPIKTQWECATFTEDLASCACKLLDMGITEVAMESTGVYWKPVFNVWARKGLTITVGNAAHMKNVPGRKTDANDSEWIAQLHRCGMIRGSFIPETEFQTLRLLNRHRQSLVGQTTRLKNQMEKVLEDGNIKLSSIISDLFGVFGLTILDCLAQNKTDTATLFEKACEVTSFEKLKRKDEVKKALSNCLRAEHCFLIKQLLQQYRGLKRYTDEVDAQMEEKLKPYQEYLTLLDDIPGINTTIAKGIIAEATTNMASFKDDRAFAAWCGVAAGNNESARKKKECEVEKAIPTSGHS